MSQQAPDDNLIQPPGSRLVPGLGRISEWPWWLLAAIFIGLVVVYRIITDERMNTIFWRISEGISVTITVTVTAYAIAIFIGLFVGLARVSKNVVIYNVASFYVEIIRGFPMLVLLMYVAFGILPQVINSINALGDWWLTAVNIDSGFGVTLSELSGRTEWCLPFGEDPFCIKPFSDMAKVTVALGIAYGAFSAEIFRAGIESVERGQMEAARAVGMSYSQAMRYVILPQAVRRVLPAMGNDFVAMVKDSSLVSVLGVQDVTQLAKLYAASTFLFFQTYSILAFIYLVLTIMLTRGVRWLERRLSRNRGSHDTSHI